MKQEVRLHPNGSERTLVCNFNTLDPNLFLDFFISV